MKRATASTPARLLQKNHLLRINVVAHADPIHIDAAGEPRCVKLHGMLAGIQLLVQQRRDLLTEDVEIFNVTTPEVGRLNWMFVDGLNGFG